MRLVVVFGSRWTVTAICDSDGKSYLRKGIDGLQGRTAKDKVTIQRRIEYLAANGRFHNDEHGHPLGDDLYEAKGKFLRVLYFRDGSQLIVCCNTCLKGKGKVFQQEKQRAKQLRTSYFDAKAQGRVETVEEEEE
jgi:hypothetical protein